MLQSASPCELWAAEFSDGQAEHLKRCQQELEGPLYEEKLRLGASPKSPQSKGQLVELPIREGFETVRWGASQEEFKAVVSYGDTYQCSVGICSPKTPGTSDGKSFFFTEDKLTSVLWHFESSDYSYMRDRFLEQYGQPTSRETKTIQNAFGAKFQNEHLYWAGKTVTIMLDRFDERLDRGSAMFMLRSALRESATKRRDDQKKKKPVERF